MSALLASGAVVVCGLLGGFLAGPRGWLLGLAVGVAGALVGVGA